MEKNDGDRVYETAYINLSCMTGENVSSNVKLPPQTVQIGNYIPTLHM